MHDSIAVTVDNLSFSYGENRVLQKVSFHIKEKEMVTMVGPNGGGKTTILLLLLGLLTPESGRVLVRGKKPELMRGVMGYVPQHTLFDPSFPVTVLDVVLMGRLKKRFGFYAKSDYAIARETLETVGLADLEGRPFSDLSGGQRQRVLIARALAGKPELLLLDEPTANVDIVVGEHLHELLRKLNRQMTILLVTHDMGFVANFTSRVLCVNRTLVEHPTELLDKGSLSETTRRLYGTPVAAVRHDLTPDCRRGHDA